MISDFDNFSIHIESDVLSNDFDDIDLYGDKYDEDETDECVDNIQFE